MLKMPELPEVETIKQDLKRLIVGAKILEITTNSAKQVKPSLEVVKKAVVGRKIAGVERKGKMLIIKLGDKSFLLIHLKLTGRLLVRNKNDPPDDWQRVTIKLKTQSTKRKSKDLELRFCDLRKFGWMKLANSNQLSVVSDQLGIEPLMPEFTLENFSRILKSSSRPVKLILMDQTKIAGIGNIYASEALFVAGIRPDRPATKLRNYEITKLQKAVKKVLKAGIKYRGASDQYYLDALGQKGAYQEHFLVYQREGKKCLKCDGIIKRITLGGRGTFFCPQCQK